MTHEIDIRFWEAIGELVAAALIFGTLLFRAVRSTNRKDDRDDRH